MQCVGKVAFRGFLSFVLVWAQVLVGTNSLAAQTNRELSPDVPQAIHAMEALQNAIPRDGFDPHALVDKLGSGGSIESLFAFVRDNTRLAPYSGALRGSSGTLMDGTGNSLDRALLLAEMLRVAGHEVRLAHGTLTRDVARSLRDAIATGIYPDSIAKSFQQYRRTITKAIADSPASTEPDLSSMFRAIEEGIAQFEETAEAATKPIAAHAEALVDAVKMPPTDQMDEADRHTERLREHWWVQVHNSAGSWIDLDPTLPSAVLGETLVQAEETVPIDASRPVEYALSEARFHRLAIRFVIEQWSSEGLNEETSLDVVLTPALTRGAPVVMQVVPTKSPDIATVLEEKDPIGKIGSSILAMTEWQPRLSIGKDVIRGEPFNDKGNLTSSEKTSGGGLFGGAFEQLAEQLEGAEGGYLTAAWIEYQTLTPEGSRPSIRRQIFDLIGPAQRASGSVPQPSITPEHSKARALALSDRIEILPMTSWISPAFLADLQANNFLFNAGAIEAVLSGAAPSESDDVESPSGLLTLAPYGLALLRYAASPVRRDIFIGGVNVLTSHQRFTQSEAGAYGVELSLDIVFNGVDVWPGRAADSRALRMQQGVTDTVAEAFLLPRSRITANTATFVAASASKELRWSVLHKKDGLAELDVSADIRARMANAIADNQLVFAPERALDATGEVAWWQIDPRTGTTLGISRYGWGQDVSEYRIITRIARAVEPHTEYIVIATLVSICAIAGGVRFVRINAISRRICVADYPDLDLDAIDEKAEDEKAEGVSGGPNLPPNWKYYVR